MNYTDVYNHAAGNVQDEPGVMSSGFLMHLGSPQSVPSARGQKWEIVRNVRKSLFALRLFGMVEGRRVF